MFFFLTLSLPVTTQETLVDSVDQYQTAQNMQSDLWSTPSTLLFHLFFSQWKSTIYLFASERVNIFSGIFDPQAIALGLDESIILLSEIVKDFSL